MAQFEEINVFPLSGRRVDMRLVDAEGTSNPVIRGKRGREFYADVKFDESDVRELHAKLGEIIEGWDA